VARERAQVDEVNLAALAEAEKNTRVAVPMRLTIPLLLVGLLLAVGGVVLLRISVVTQSPVGVAGLVLAPLGIGLVSVAFSARRFHRRVAEAETHRTSAST